MGMVYTDILPPLKGVGFMLFLNFVPQMSPYSETVSARDVVYTTRKGERRTVRSKKKVGVLSNEQ
jgi:hypothetical protein